MDSRKYTYEELLQIVETLRSDTGCPWDREQTHMSLRPCMTEEAAEVLGAIRILENTGSFENLIEELGDVLLQVVMHSQIAKEEGLFNIEDVVSGIAEKMVRRHPHVFGDAAADSAGQALENWEEIKKKEKEGKEQVQTPLREIPRELPALTRAMKVQKKADKLYAPQPNYAESVRRLQAAAEKLEQYRPGEDEEEMEVLFGDALEAISRMAGLCRVPLEQILTDRTEELIEALEPV